MQRAQIGERSGRRCQLDIGSRLPFGEFRRQQADDQKRNVGKPDKLNRVRDGVAVDCVDREGADTAEGEQRAASERRRAADGGDHRAAWSEKQAGHSNDDDIERCIRRTGIAGRPDDPSDQQHVGEKLKAGLRQIVLPQKACDAIDNRQSANGDQDWCHDPE